MDDKLQTMQLKNKSVLVDVVREQICWELNRHSGKLFVFVPPRRGKLCFYEMINDSQINPYKLIKQDYFEFAHNPRNFLLVIGAHETSKSNGTIRCQFLFKGKKYISSQFDNHKFENCFLRVTPQKYKEWVAKREHRTNTTIGAG